MVMHLYDRACVNRAGLKVLGWNKETPNPFGGVIERDASGNPTGLLAATVGLVALVSAWLKIPRLSEEDQMVSTRHFMREHNRLGITSVIDAGGGGQNYPDNYQAIAKLAAEDKLTLRGVEHSRGSLVSAKLAKDGDAIERKAKANLAAKAKQVASHKEVDLADALGL